ncbi:MAG: hypothetical protein ACJ76F_10260 [Bacteroidia bacterium]
MDISIKKPCHENWDAMTPNEQGAFCHKCVKSVIDFSEKTIEEIKAYFAKKSEEKVCGRFREDQMTELSFDGFFERFRAFHFTKKMAVVLYFTFGLWLFSPGNAEAQSTQHLKGDVAVEQPITKKGKVKVVGSDTSKCVKDPKQNNTSEKDQIIMGKVVAPTQVTPKATRRGQVKATAAVVPAKQPAIIMKQGEVKLEVKEDK